MKPSGSTCFLSYAREDSEAAVSLYQSLTEAGANVWFDQESLQPGERFEPSIRRAIRNSRYFLPLLSSRSVSKIGFVQREIQEALKVLAEYPEDEIYIVPLRLDECAPSHEALRELNWVDLFPTPAAGVRKLFRLLQLGPTAVVVTGAGGDATEGTGLVRFDGHYISRSKSGGARHARFYEDGTVITVSTGGPGDVDTVARWFNRENAGAPSRGRYAIEGRSIRFSTTSQLGMVDYEGVIAGDVILLRTHSHINGNRGVIELEFASYAEAT